MQIHGFLQFLREEIVTPYSKYQVERAQNKPLVDCCRADKPNEDQLSWSCTLFEPVYVDGDAQTLRLCHIQLEHYACLWRLPPPYGSCLFVGSASPDKDHCDADNGYYLKARVIEGHPYLEFTSSDIGDPIVGNEAFTTHDGSVFINPDWIWANFDNSTTNNLDTLFWPVRVNKNLVALHNFGSNNFCNRLTIEGKTNYLNVGVSTISKKAHLEVIELVLSRNIYNVNFCLMDARIYNQRVIVKLSYTETKSRTWKGNVSLKLGVQITIENGVLFIANEKLEISFEFSMKIEYNVIVLAMTRVTLSMIATQASCDVHFSYSQHDTLIDGKNIIYNMDDGVYNGVNCFNVKYQTKEEKL
ncbi:hypothetical protein PVL29_009106 [Vitis rotundifolia]|uniref:Agglutinin domain-containing protein n=1 Tax=Vitis rotundifolia TaxID=103349 RepID=A0AA38ZZH9_VITRO|nr:hypothetical protein PVL29_009106 [Vitis rotundifolia]